MANDLKRCHKTDFVEIKLGDCLHLNFDLYITADSQSFVYDRDDLQCSVQKFVSDYFKKLKGGSANGESKKDAKS